jgi:ribosome-binding factor A
MLRSEVGRQLSTRLVPTLEFIPDALPENADHIGALLRQAQERDAEVAKLASSASHAGDADPYRADEDKD